jgi:hypothetical protein
MDLSASIQIPIQKLNGKSNFLLMKLNRLTDL